MRHLARTSALTAALACATLTLAACGGTSTSGGSSAAGSASHSGDTRVTAADAKTVTVYSADGLGDW